MTFEMDDDAKAVARDRQGNHTLIQWLSWCIWRTIHGFQDMEPHPNRTEHFATKQITGQADRGLWLTTRITDIENYP